MFLFGYIFIFQLLTACLFDFFICRNIMLLRKVSQTSALCGAILRVPPVLSGFVKLANI